MKRLVLLLALLIVTGPPLNAQEEIIPPKRTRAAKFGFYGGVTPGWLFVDVGPLNAFLTAANGAPLKDNGIFLFGGGGAAYVGIISNFRVGGLGMGGGISSTSVDGLGVRRDADMNVGFGGVTLEYVLPVVPRLDVAFGAMIGWGGVDLTLRQDAGGNLTWDDEWVSFGSGNYGLNQVRNIKRTLSGSFFVWLPSVNVEFAVVGWLGVRIGAGYLGMSAPSWTVDDKYDLSGTPGNINGKGFMLNGGIFVGTF